MVRALAIVCARNEAIHIARCIDDLIRGGCDVCLIDHDSGDRTVELARRFLGRGLIGIERLPWSGRFSLTDQLEAKRAVARRSAHDWIVHADADEWLVSPVRGQTLIDAIRDADASGFNVINFHEIVFVPISSGAPCDGNYARSMDEYYFFQPRYPRLNRAWRRDAMLDNLPSGGHLAEGPNVRLSPHDLILRHYIVLSQEHARLKYLDRKFSDVDLDKGWHINRITIDARNLVFRRHPALRRLPAPLDHDKFDLSQPVASHFWEWPEK